MDMALVHTLNAFSWPLLILAVLLGLWKLATVMSAGRVGQPRPAQSTVGAFPGGSSPDLSQAAPQQSP